MKTIKIFLASSSELACDRNAFGNFIRQLDDIYEKRGWRIKLFEWVHILIDGIKISHEYSVGIMPWYA